MKFHLPFGIGAKRESLLCISKSEYQDLMSYARDRNVKLEGFKRFTGDISLIKEFVDDVVTVAEDFPRILTDRKCLVVRLDEYSPDDDFATTDRHLISINAKIFNNKEYLRDEYSMLAEMGKFVRGTDYRSVARHELGHVVANIYRIDPMKIAKDILCNRSDFEVLEYIHDNVSMYAGDYEDGREIISECFSAFYGKRDIPFVKEYINKCKEVVKEDCV